MSDLVKCRWPTCEDDTDCMNGCKPAATVLEAQAKELEALTDPVAVHLNMLRGGIAKPSWANIKHLYPTEFAEIESRAETAEREWNSYEKLYNDELVERLRAERKLAKAKEALKPFSDAAKAYDPDKGEPDTFGANDALWGCDGLTIGHLRAARAITGKD